MKNTTNKRAFFILFIIMVLASIIRTCHLNFPSIGYHNMKENEYISMAQHMERNGDLISREVYFYHAFDNDLEESFDLYPQVPFVAYQILLGYKLFGPNLWFPRLINIALMLLAILVCYFLTSKLIGDSFYGLLAAVLMSVLPLGVYFSRNLQPESGAFFFSMLGILFFFKFLDKFKGKYLFGLGICFTISAAYKLSFLITLFPLVVLFPYRKYFSKTNPSDIFKHLFLLCSPFLILVCWWIIMGQLLFPSIEGRVSPLEIFSIGYWKKNGPLIWRYTEHENFTLVFFILFIVGVIISWVGFRKDKTFLAKYLRANSVFVVVYFAIFSDFVNQHSYYQMPFFGFFCLSVVYGLATLIPRIFWRLKSEQQRAISLCIFSFFLLLALPGLTRAIKATYSTLFLGQDVVGQYLKSIMDENERFFIRTFAQGYGSCVYAERKCGWPQGLENFKSAEEKYGVQYIVVYPFYFLNKIKGDLRHYIQKNYHTKLIGFLSTKGELTPSILVLKKGGGLDVNKFLEENRNELKLEKIYYTIKGKIPFYIMEED